MQRGSNASVHLLEGAIARFPDGSDLLVDAAMVVTYCGHELSMWAYVGLGDALGPHRSGMATGLAVRAWGARAIGRAAVGPGSQVESPRRAAAAAAAADYLAARPAWLAWQAVACLRAGAAALGSLGPTVGAAVTVLALRLTAEIVAVDALGAALAAFEPQEWRRSICTLATGP